MYLLQVCVWYKLPSDDPAVLSVNAGLGRPVRNCPADSELRSVVVSDVSPFSFTSVASVYVSMTVFDSASSGATSMLPMNWLKTAPLKPLFSRNVLPSALRSVRILVTS